MLDFEIVHDRKKCPSSANEYEGTKVVATQERKLIACRRVPVAMRSSLLHSKAVSCWTTTTTTTSVGIRKRGKLATACKMGDNFTARRDESKRQKRFRTLEIPRFGVSVRNGGELWERLWGWFWFLTLPRPRIRTGSRIRRTKAEGKIRERERRAVIKGWRRGVGCGLYVQYLLWYGRRRRWRRWVRSEARTKLVWLWAHVYRSDLVGLISVYFLGRFKCAKRRVFGAACEGEKATNVKWWKARVLHVGTDRANFSNMEQALGTARRVRMEIQFGIVFRRTRSRMSSRVAWAGNRPENCRDYESRVLSCDARISVL